MYCVDLEIRIRGFDETHLMSGLQKIANRITVELGLRWLRRVQTDFRLFGHPGFDMILFMGATAAGLSLVVYFGDD